MKEDRGITRREVPCLRVWRCPLPAWSRCRRSLSSAWPSTSMPNVGHTRTGAILGTPSYMAPEQAAGRGKEVGPAVDIYALRALLYQLLTGRPPFQGETATDILDQVLHADPLPPVRLQPRV